MLRSLKIFADGDNNNASSSVRFTGIDSGPTSTSKTKQEKSKNHQQPKNDTDNKGGGGGGSSGNIIGCFRIVPRYVAETLITNINTDAPITTAVAATAGPVKQQEILRNICNKFFGRRNEPTVNTVSPSSSSSSAAVQNGNNSSNYRDSSSRDRSGAVGHNNFTFDISNEVYTVKYKVEYLSEEGNDTLVLTLSAVTLIQVGNNNDISNSNHDMKILGGPSVKGNDHVGKNDKSQHKNRLRTTKHAAIFPNDDIVWEIIQMLVKTFPNDFPCDAAIAPTKEYINLRGREKLELVLKHLSPSSFGIKKSTNSRILNSEEQEALKFLQLFTIEVATDHYARYLSPNGQRFCDWIHPNLYLCVGQKSDIFDDVPNPTTKRSDGEKKEANSSRVYPTKSLYQITNASKEISNAKSQCIHIINREYNSPLLAVAWSGKQVIEDKPTNTSVNQLGVYKLYSGKQRFVQTQILKVEFLEKVNVISSTKRGKTWVLLVGCNDGYLAVLPLSLYDSAKAPEIVSQEFIRVHPDSINAIHVSGDLVYTCSNDRSFCVLKWFWDRDINRWRLKLHPSACPYSTDCIINDVPQLIGIQLSIASLPRESENPVADVDHVEEDIFTTGWQDIRYWKQLDGGKWTTHLFPNGHVKKVACMAVFDFGKSGRTAALKNDFSSSHNQTTTACRCRKHQGTDRVPNFGCCFCNRGDKRTDRMCRVLVSGSVDKTAIVWDITNPMDPMKVRHLLGHEGDVTTVKIVPMDGISPMVITASNDNTIRCWDLLSGEAFRIMKTSGTISSLDVLSVSDDQDMTGEMIVTSEGGEILVRNFLNNHREITQYHDSGVLAIAVCPSNICNREDKQFPIASGTSSGDCVISIQGRVVDILRHKPDELLEFEQNKQKKTEEQQNTERWGKVPAQVGGSTKTRVKEGQPRVNAVITFEICDSSAQTPTEKVQFIVTGLGCGVVVIWRENKQTHQFERHCWFIGNNATVFTLALYDPHLDTFHGFDDKEKRTLLFVGGLSKEIQVWSLPDLLSKRDQRQENESIEETYAKLCQQQQQQGGNAAKQQAQPETNFFVDNAKALSSTTTHLKTAHSNNIRSIVMHYPSSSDMQTLFFTGSYDTNTIIWDLKTQTPLVTLSGLHKQFVLAIEIYDPVLRLKKDQLPLDELIGFEKTCKNIKDHLVVVTGGYDGKIGLWAVEKAKLCIEATATISATNLCNACEKAPNKVHSDANKSNKEGHICSSCGKAITFSFKDYLSMRHENDESVTALALHVPKSNSTQSPLIVTGSIDNLIYIWSLYSQERIQVITGHSNRVNFLTLYTRPTNSSNDEVILLSGSDDGSLIFWEDALDLQPPPLSKSQVLRSFYKDIHVIGGDEQWKLMKLLRAMNPHLFIEFPFLFYLALVEKQESFFVEFEDDLKQVIADIPSFKCSLAPHCKHPVDILEYAIHTHSLVALRAILVSWQHVLNQDITDSLAQKLLVATYSFNEATLLELARSFPVEYTDFLYSLKLVRNHATTDCLQLDNLFTTIPDGKRTSYIGSNDVNDALRVGPHYAKSVLNRYTSLLDRIYWMFNHVLSVFQYRPPVLDQPVMPFSTPIKRFATIQQFAALIETSNVIDNLIVFDSQIVRAAIHHFWDVYGWKVHVVAILQYFAAVILFVASIYLYPGAAQEYSDFRYRQVQRANVLFGLMMVLYGIDEVLEIVGKCWLLYRSRLNVSLFFQLVFHHFLGDVWNMIDAGIIATGLYGVIVRFKTLASCFENKECDAVQYETATTSSNCVLAVTAVLLWFKVLYFLRPSKAAGQFVAMVITIIKDIKYFLFVLACVLIGFAQGFWLMINASSTTTAFATVKMSYFSTFMYMFGNINMDDLEGAGSTPFVTIFLVAFMLTMMLLMLNLLIALMGDSFARTKENIQRIYRKELASFMIEQCMPTVVLAILSFLGILQYHEDNLIFVIKYTSDLRDENEDKDALMKALEVCKKVMEVSPENIANAPKTPREKDIIDR